MKYLIWSIEHDAWWNPERAGYTREKSKAGRYSFEDAKDIVTSANLNFRIASAGGDIIDKPNEAMVPE